MKEMKWHSLQTPADADELLTHSSQSATCLHLVRQVFVIKHTQGAPLIKAAVARARARCLCRALSAGGAPTLLAAAARFTAKRLNYEPSPPWPPPERTSTPRGSPPVSAALLFWWQHMARPGSSHWHRQCARSPERRPCVTLLRLNQVETHRQKKSYQRPIIITTTTTIIIITSAGLLLWRRQLFRSLFLEAFVGDLLCVS